jgi:hypothetical protein
LNLRQSQQVTMKSPIFWDVTPCILLAACFTGVSCVAYSSTLKMEQACSTES